MCIRDSSMYLYPGCWMDICMHSNNWTIRNDSSPVARKFTASSSAASENRPPNQTFFLAMGAAILLTNYSTHLRIALRTRRTLLVPQSSAERLGSSTGPFLATWYFTLWNEAESALSASVPVHHECEAMPTVNSYRQAMKLEL